MTTETRAERTRRRLLELRDIANRLAVGEPESRWLRGLICEVIGVLADDHQEHFDIESSGARFPPPEMIKPPTPATAKVPPPAVFVPRGDAPTLGNLHPRSIAAGMARAAGAAGAPALPAEPAPDPNVPDPAGPGYLEELQQQLEAEETAVPTPPAAPTTNGG